MHVCVKVSDLPPVCSGFITGLSSDASVTVYIKPDLQSNTHLGFGLSTASRFWL